jgi:hypothetical protein
MMPPPFHLEWLPVARETSQVALTRVLMLLVTHRISLARGKVLLVLHTHHPRADLDHRLFPKEKGEILAKLWRLCQARALSLGGSGPALLRSGRLLGL